MRARSRLLIRLAFAASSLLAAGGCYDHHRRPADDTEPGLAIRTEEPPRERLRDQPAVMDASLVPALPEEPLHEPPRPQPPDPASCRVEPPIDPFTDPVLEYRWPNGRVAPHSASIHVCATPLVVDLSPRSGELPEPSLVFVSYAQLGRLSPPGVLRIVDPETDETLSYPAREDQEAVLAPTGTLAAGDLNGDGSVEIVGLGAFSGTYAFDAGGELIWSSPYPSFEEREESPRRMRHTIGPAPTLTDLEGDGEVEVISGRNVLDGATGALRFSAPEDSGRGINGFLGPIPCAADLDGDGVQEVIVGRTALRADGSVLWHAQVPDGLCAVADVDKGSEGPEVVLVAAGFVQLLSGTGGEVLWSQRLAGRVRESLGGAPTVADFDGDGAMEIGVAHGAAYGVYDPACKAAREPAGCEARGTLWHAPTQDDSSSGTGSSVFDFNGDGRAEVIYNDQTHFRIYDGSTGRALFEHPNSSRTRTENPAIADVDGDGDAEIVFSANAEASFIRDHFTDPGVEVWGDARGRWVGARQIWNQHAYHIDNVEPSGRIPTGDMRAHNTFRQNLREGGDVLVTPDLWAKRGSFECLGSRQALLSVQVENRGLERVGPGVVVGFYRGAPDAGGERVGEAETTTRLLPGDSETVSFKVELRDEVRSYYAVLDDPRAPGGDAVAECREQNNVTLIWQPNC